MNRRKFLKSSCALCAAGAVGTIAFLESCKKSNNSSANSTPQGPTVNFTLDLSLPANSALNNAGGSLASNGVIVANSSGNYIAVAQSCTHNGCSVSYQSNGNDFYCPCHGGTFDTNGNVTAGPPPAPLKKYTVTKSGSILTVKG